MRYPCYPCFELQFPNFQSNTQPQNKNIQLVSNLISMTLKQSSRTKLKFFKNLTITIHSEMREGEIVNICVCVCFFFFFEIT